jgi:sec-independent protein translocase protein TatA
MFGMSQLGFLNFGPQELIIFGIIAILLFGKKLPDVARRVGGSYREFRKGLSEMKSSYRDVTSSYMDDIDDNYSTGKGYAGEDENRYDDNDEATAPKFEPPPSEPRAGGTDASTDASDDASDDARPAATDVDKD